MWFISLDRKKKSGYLLNGLAFQILTEMFIILCTFYKGIYIFMMLISAVAL